LGVSRPILLLRFTVKVSQLQEKKRDRPLPRDIAADQHAISTPPDWRLRQLLRELPKKRQQSLLRTTPTLPSIKSSIFQVSALVMAYHEWRLAPVLDVRRKTLE